MPREVLAYSQNKRLEPFYYPELAKTRAVNLAEGTYQKGQWLGQVTATPGTFAAYDADATDGTETAVCLCVYDCTVDADGNVALVSVGISDITAGGTTAPVYDQGYFHTSDLVGTDAAALVDVHGRVVEGTLASGVIYIP